MKGETHAFSESAGKIFVNNSKAETEMTEDMDT